jgi:hypothetical protein
MVALRGFPPSEVEELWDTFAGAIENGESSDGVELLVVRTELDATLSARRTKARHRGGSAACKYFLDGTPFLSEEQVRDCAVISESDRLAAYEADGAVLIVAPAMALVAAGESLPQLLLSDIVENWLLCRARLNRSVQVHCSAWIEDEKASLVVGSSTAGKTTELFASVRAGASFLSNDRAFLRVRDERLEVRSFPLPVNIGCGTIRGLSLDLPTHGLEDDDKIRLRPKEAAERFGADYRSWFPVHQITCRSMDDLWQNTLFQADPAHPFWIKPWHPGLLDEGTVHDLRSAIVGVVQVAGFEHTAAGGGPG